MSIFFPSKKSQREKLAEKGIELSGKAEYVQVELNPLDVVVLDRVARDFVPGYHVCGYTDCSHCKHMVYLGHNTAKAVTHFNATPLCIECATKIVPRGARFLGQVFDPPPDQHGH